MRTTGLNMHTRRRRASSIVVASSGPPVAPTLAWFDPSDLTSLTVAAGLCSQMNDKSGNGHNVTAAGTARPQSGVNTIGGLNALTFDGNANVLASAILSVPQPITSFVVLQRITAVPASGAEVLGNTSGQLTYVLFAAGGTGFWSVNAGATIASAVAADTSAHVLDVLLNGASTSINLDRTQIAAGNAGTQGYGGAAAVLPIGSQPGVANIGFPGAIGEVVMYNTALSGSDRLAVENYLKAKWGTP